MYGQLTHSANAQDASQNIAFIQGRVIDCNPAAMTVDALFEEGRCVSGVPVVNTVGSPFGDDFQWTVNARGSVALFLVCGAQYFMLCTLPQQAGSRMEKPTPPALESGHGGDDPTTYGNQVFRDFSLNRAADFYPGDKLLRAEGHTGLGLFRGGIAKLQASPLAQIILGKYKDFCRIISRKFQLFTDFGEVEITQNGQGRTSCTLRGGADYAGETHPQQQRWTVQALLGDDPANPDIRLKTRVNNPQNTEFVQTTHDITGTINTALSGDQYHTVGRDQQVKVFGGRALGVGKDLTTRVLGNESREISGELNTVAGGNTSLTVTGQYTAAASKDMVLSSNTRIVLAATQGVAFTSKGGTCDVSCGKINFRKA